VLGNGRETEEEAGEEYGDAEVAIEELKTLSLRVNPIVIHHWTGSPIPCPLPPLGMQQQDTPFQTRVNYAQLSIFST